MPDTRFELLYPPLHALQERLKAELARNPFLAPARPDPGGEDRPDGDGPASSSSEDPDEQV